MKFKKPIIISVIFLFFAVSFIPSVNAAWWQDFWDDEIDTVEGNSVAWGGCEGTSGPNIEGNSDIYNGELINVETFYLYYNDGSLRQTWVFETYLKNGDILIFLSVYDEFGNFLYKEVINSANQPYTNAYDYLIFKFFPKPKKAIF